MLSFPNAEWNNDISLEFLTLSVLAKTNCRKFESFSPQNLRHKSIAKDVIHVVLHHQTIIFCQTTYPKTITELDEFSIGEALTALVIALIHTK